MKKFPHQQFIEDNGIVIDTLPTMLQKRIHGFEELQEDLEHTTEHDREQFLDKLDLLSLELEEDLEEQFEEQLENNDVEDEVSEELVLTLGEVEDKPVLEEKVIAEDVEENNVPAIPIPEPQIIAETKSETDDDEDILGQLFLKKQLTVSPAQLIRKGFRKKLDNKLIAVGKYALYRGKYDTCYTLLLKEK